MLAVVKYVSAIIIIIIIIIVSGIFVISFFVIIIVIFLFIPKSASSYSCLFVAAVSEQPFVFLRFTETCHALVFAAAYQPW